MADAVRADIIRPNITHAWAENFKSQSVREFDYQKSDSAVRFVLSFKQEENP
jgi:hypothetical protein